MHVVFLHDNLKWLFKYSTALFAIVLISIYLAELQYLKYIVIPKCRYRDMHT